MIQSPPLKVGTRSLAASAALLFCQSHTFVLRFLSVTSISFFFLMPFVAIPVLTPHVNTDKMHLFLHFVLQRLVGWFGFIFLRIGFEFYYIIFSIQLNHCFDGSNL